MRSFELRIGDSVKLTLPDGTPVTVMFCRLDQGTARIGLDAPLSVRIWREEVRGAPIGRVALEPMREPK
jgi:sRNA-binding carbon storage regulator CsrA